MSRNKKSRKPGSTGDMDLIVVRNRNESDVEGRLRKKLKKRKGQKTGSRHSMANEQRSGAKAEKRDPRIGSKKKIPLVVEAKKKPSKQERRLSAEQELAMLENDGQLNVLLDRIENGENLGAGLQRYVDEKLDRIEALMQQLGLLDEQEESEAEQAAEPAKPEVASKKKAASDDDLLAQFEGLDLNDLGK